MYPWSSGFQSYLSVYLYIPYYIPITLVCHSVFVLLYAVQKVENVTSSVSYLMCLWKCKLRCLPGLFSVPALGYDAQITTHLENVMEHVKFIETLFFEYSKAIFHEALIQHNIPASAVDPSVLDKYANCLVNFNYWTADLKRKRSFFVQLFC